MLTTRLCRELSIEHPILCAPLGGGMAGPELAAAVSEAGGLGLLGMGGVPARVIREQIRDTRRRTSKPFGAGLLLPLLEGGEVDACIEERVSVLLFFWGDVAPHVEKVKRAGIRVFAQVGSVEEAKAAAAAGVDAIVAQGFEAGGHVRGTTSLMTLIPAVLQAVAPLPVIAAGGIATGRGMLAALGLGAEAVSMGTRFVASEESRAAPEYKQRIVRARAEDTVHTMLFDIGWPDAAHRVIRNKAIDEWEAAGSPPSGQRPGRRHDRRPHIIQRPDERRSTIFRRQPAERFRGRSGLHRAIRRRVVQSRERHQAGCRNCSRHRRRSGICVA